MESSGIATASATAAPREHDAERDIEHDYEHDNESSGLGQTFDRLYSFRFTYLALVLFIVVYLYSVRIAEALLDSHFRAVVAEAIVVRDLELPVALQIQARMEDEVHASPWVRWGGVLVDVTVLGRDGRSWIYVGHAAVPPPPTIDPFEVIREAERLLPASADVSVVVPHNAVLANVILVLWGGLLVQTLYLRNRSIARREQRELEEATRARDESAERSRSIEEELARTRGRLREIEPENREHLEEIETLEQERAGLQRQLAAVAAREEELRGRNAKVNELAQEMRALEDLLEEAGGDLASRDQAIRDLERSLKRASRGGSEGKTTGKGRGQELLARRLRTLYKNIEIDDKAISDLVALRDETMKLKAEEAIKRLADEADNVAVRRKVGGLPPHLSIFELGFAGKGRIYYARGAQQHFRVLTVGAKNTQKVDLEYLSRLKDL